MRLSIRSSLVACALAACAAPAWAVPMVGGCQVFPANHYWNTPIDQLPVDTTNSTNWVNSIGAATRLHADWGNKLDDGSGFNEIIGYGIPFVAGPSPQLATVTFDVDDESDPNPYRIPSNAPVEGGAGSGGDMHVVSIDTTTCKLYELYSATQTSATTWNAFSGAIFDLNSNALRPDGYTSADASGMALFPGLVRWEEVAAGEIAHAIRFTANHIWASTATGHKYIWPATHWSGSTNNSLYPPMGARFRLKASFNISGFDSRTQVILRAFKKYGLVLVDGGSNWYFQGMSNVNWPDIVITQLNSNLIHGSDFEVVDTTLLKISPTSALAVQVPGAPTNLTAAAGNGQATFTFTAPPDGGSPIVTSALYPAYKITCGAVAGTGTSSPITVTGLTNGTPYTCSIAAANVTGVGPPSTTVNVTPGQGVLSAVSSVDFGPSAVGVNNTKMITITNTGSGNTGSLSVNISGTNAALFSQTSNCAGQSLVPNGTCTVNMTVNPSAVGPFGASVTLSGATTSPVTIAMSGSGFTVPDAPTIAPAVAGNGQAWIFFAPPNSDGGSPITGYPLNCSPAPLGVSGTTSPLLLTGLTNGTPYTCSVTATNAAGTSAPSANVIVTPSATPALGVIGVQSRKFHTGIQDFDVLINSAIAITGPVSVEPRAIGAGHRIVFQFNAPITNAGTATAVNAASAAVGTATPNFSSNEVTVTLTGIADNQRVKVSLSNVNNAGFNTEASLGFLVGDVNGSRRINASDISAVKARDGRPASQNDFKFDLDAKGTVGQSDVVLVKAASGRVLP